MIFQMLAICGGPGIAPGKQLGAEPPIHHRSCLMKHIQSPLTGSAPAPRAGEAEHPGAMSQAVMARPGELLLGLNPWSIINICRKCGSWVSRSHPIAPFTSGQGLLFLNPPCVPNLPLKTFKFQADNLNLSPYKANPLLLNVGKNLLLSLLR